MKGKNASLAKVFSDIQDIKIKKSDSFNTMRRKFYDVMRKHGIKQGTKNKHGQLMVNNPEWQASEFLFEEQIRSFVALTLCLECFETPKDLEAY